VSDWKDVTRALLGTWPNQIAAWGREALAAYCAEVQARGITPDAALAAIRSAGAQQKFPLSVPELAGLARRDPSLPTFDEAFQLIYGSGGVLRARPVYNGPIYDADTQRDEAARKRMAEIHPMAASFIERYGLDHLRTLEVDDPEYGELRRRDLRERWDAHCAAMEDRAVIAIGRRDGLRGLDPLAVLRPSAAQIAPPNGNGHQGQ
jgi:hypothetical protein